MADIELSTPLVVGLSVGAVAVWAVIHTLLEYRKFRRGEPSGFDADAGDLIDRVREEGVTKVGEELIKKAANMNKDDELDEEIDDELEDDMEDYDMDDSDMYSDEDIDDFSMDATPEELLFIAAVTGYEEELQALLDGGMDIDTRDGDGHTPLMYTASGDSPACDSEQAQGLAEKIDTLLCSRGDDNDDTWLERETTPVRMTRYLLDHGADVNARDAKGHTALMHAARNSHIAKETPHPGLDIIAMLLAAGADINAADSGGCTALHHAALSGQDDLVEALLQAGADTTLRTKDGRDFADCLAEGEVTGVLRRVLAAPDADLEAPDTQGRTRLMRLDSRLQAPVARLLLELGADMDAKDKDGVDVYSHILRCESEALAIPFIGRGKDIPAGMDRTEMFEIAAEDGDLKALQRLVDHFHPAPDSEEMLEALRKAAMEGRCDVVEFLLAAGVDPDSVPPDSFCVDDDDEDDYEEGVHAKGTLVKEVLSEGKKDIRTVRTLIKAGANVFRWDFDDDCNACLIEVADSGSLEMLQLLEEAGVDPKDSDANELLDIAAKSGHLAMVEHLLDHLKITKTGLNEAFDSAVYNGYHELARRLLDRGAKVRKSTMVIAAEGKDPAMLRWLLDLGYKGDWGDMLLAAAAEVRDGQVRILLERGAKVSRRDGDGRTALMRAICTFDHPAFAREDIVRALLAAGADPDAKDAKGYTPITSSLCWLGYWGRRIIPMLVQAGADLPATTPKGKPIADLVHCIPLPAPIEKALGLD